MWQRQTEQLRVVTRRGGAVWNQNEARDEDDALKINAVIVLLMVSCAFGRNISSHFTSPSMQGCCKQLWALWKKKLFGPHPKNNLLSILLIGCSGPSHDCWLHRVSTFTVYHTSNHKISSENIFSKDWIWSHSPEKALWQHRRPSNHSARHKSPDYYRSTAPFKYTRM